uniref:Uncharacterized protein n=1 Tax=Arundo donax TaxID=35708 RepID=A0A0A9FB65_ARUDO
MVAVAVYQLCKFSLKNVRLFEVQKKRKRK